MKLAGYAHYLGAFLVAAIVAGVFVWGMYGVVLRLTYAFTWTTTQIDASSDNNRGQAVSLAAETAGTVHLAYCDGSTTGTIRYAKMVNSVTSTVTTVEDQATTCARRTIDIAWDGTRPVIAFQGTSGTNYIHFASNNGGSSGNANDAAWNFNTVTTSAWTYGRVAVAVTGTTYGVAFQDQTNRDVYYGSCTTNCATSGSWTLEAVSTTPANVGDGLDLAFDWNGNAVVAFNDATNSRISYAIKNGSGSGTKCANTNWNCYTVDSSRAAADAVAVAIDGKGRIGIAYDQITSAAPRLAYKGGAASVCSGDETSSFICFLISGASTMDYPSVAFHGTNPVVSWYENDTTDNLVFGYTNGSASWTTENVVTTGDVGLYSSIVRVNNIVNIAYYDQTNTEAALATSTVALNSAPEVSGTLNPTMASTTAVTVTTTIDDLDLNGTTLIVEYSTNGTTWVSSTIAAASENGEGNGVTTSTGQIAGIDTTNDGAIALTFDWRVNQDVDNTEDSTVYFQLTPDDGTVRGTSVSSSAFAIDTKDPTVPSQLTTSVTSSISLTLRLPTTTSTDGNFKEYKIFYKAGSSGVTESDTEFSSSTDSDLGNNNFNGTTTTTITGLASSTQYVFNIFAYDQIGNVTSSATELTVRTLPAVPISVAVAAAGPNSATVSWGTNGNPTGTTRYNVRNVETQKQSGRLAGTVTSFTFGDLVCGKLYTFEVQALNMASEETSFVQASPFSISCGSGGQNNPPPPPPAEPVTPDSSATSTEPLPSESATSTPSAPSEPEEEPECAPTTLLSIVKILSGGLFGSQSILYTNKKDVGLLIDTTYASSIALKETENAATSDFSDVSFEVNNVPGKTWTLTGLDGTKYINARFRNNVPSYTKDAWACVILDTKPPAAPIVEVVDNGVVDGQIVYAPLLSGTAESNAKIIIKKEKKKLGAAVASSGSALPSLSSPAFLSTSIARVAARIRLFLAAEDLFEIFTTQADALGEWSFEFPEFFDTGDYVITTRAEDKAENISDAAYSDLTIPCAEGFSCAPPPDAVTEEETTPPEESSEEEAPCAEPNCPFAETSEETTGETNEESVPEAPIGSESAEDDFSESAGLAEGALGAAEKESAEEGTLAEGGEEGGLGEDAELIETGEIVDAVSDPFFSNILPDTVAEQIAEAFDAAKEEFIETVAIVSEQLPQAAQTVAETTQKAAAGARVVATKTADAAKTVVNDPSVEQVNTVVVVPTIATAAAANVAVGFQAPQLLLYLRYLFAQPLLLLRRRKQKRWGVVYNAFTKQPVDLATVRLVDAQTGKILRSQVTDTQGRYFFTQDVGEYRIEVHKSGLGGFSKYLMKLNEDTNYANLYHGETFSIAERQNEIAYNIPLDPEQAGFSSRRVVREYSARLLHHALSLVGFGVTSLSFIVTPTPLIGGLLSVHILSYGFFRRLAHANKGAVGRVKDDMSKRPIGKTIVRIFDAQYNKLTHTTVTDRKGRYGMLVGPSVYYVTFEKPAYHKKKSHAIDLSHKKTAGIGGFIAFDATLVPVAAGAMASRKQKESGEAGAVAVPASDGFFEQTAAQPSSAPLKKQIPKDPKKFDFTLLREMAQYGKTDYDPDHQPENGDASFAALHDQLDHRDPVDNEAVYTAISHIFADILNKHDRVQDNLRGIAPRKKEIPKDPDEFDFDELRKIAEYGKADYDPKET